MMRLTTLSFGSRLILIAVLGWRFSEISASSQQGESPQEKMEKALQTPITFYGKVVDQNGAIVPDATVKMSANNMSGPKGAGTDYEVHTDAAGLFSLHDAHGFALAVFVSKKGYYRSGHYQDGGPASSGTFWFTQVPGENFYQPDQKNPAVFVLRKQGALAELVHRETNISIARDGSPATASFEKKGVEPTHALILRCWNKELEALAANERKYDWKLEISVPQGGLKERGDKFAFEAPADGYVASDTIKVTADQPRWSSSARKSYFVKFSDGTYARLDLEMLAGGDHFAVWKSYWNPKPGDKNLESGPNRK